MHQVLNKCLYFSFRSSINRQPFITSRFLSQLSAGEHIVTKPIDSSSNQTIGSNLDDIGTDNKKRYLNVSIVGRPNTGKSTLFNRITHSKDAIVSDVPGTTRDRREGIGSIAGFPINIVDTGGFDDRGSVNIDIQHQIEIAIQKSDVVLFLVDARVGVNSLDEHFAKWIRKSVGKSMMKSSSTISSTSSSSSSSKKCEVVVVANKSEGGHLSNRLLDTISDAYNLGLGDPIPISASHGDGISDLREILYNIACQDENFILELPDAHHHKDDIMLQERIIQIAIMGQPNVGKSSLLNAIIGEERVITGPIAGLTRDSIPVEWTYHDRQFRLIDTAGLTRIKPHHMLLSSNDKRSSSDRKSSSDKKIEAYHQSTGKSHHQQHHHQHHNQHHNQAIIPKVKLPGAEYMNPEADPSQYSSEVSELALMNALQALKYAQVTLLVVEGAQGKFSKIDLQLAEKCLEEGRALIIVANKRDLVALGGLSGREYEESVRKHCETRLGQFGHVCVISASATQNEGIRRLLKTIVTVHDAWSKRVDTGLLNRWIKDTLVSAPKPRISGKSLTIKYLTQIKSRPPTFVMFCNTSELPDSYLRFIKSKMQYDFHLDGIPIRIIIRKAKGNDAQSHHLKRGQQLQRGIQHVRGRGVGPKNRSPARLYQFKMDRNKSRRLQKRLKNRRVQQTRQRYN